MYKDQIDTLYAGIVLINADQHTCWISVKEPNWSP